jgi:hypothetical protein
MAIFSNKGMTLLMVDDQVSEDMMFLYKSTYMVLWEEIIKFCLFVAALKLSGWLCIIDQDVL